MLAGVTTTSKNSSHLLRWCARIIDTQSIKSNYEDVLLNDKKKVHSEIFQENEISYLTYFKPMFQFYTSGFLTFSRGIEMEYWIEMGVVYRKKCFQQKKFKK